jgi:hypothetical protein
MCQVLKFIFTKSTVPGTARYLAGLLCTFFLKLIGTALCPAPDISVGSGVGCSYCPTTAGQMRPSEMS